MRRIFAMLALALAVAGTASGCVVREQHVATGPRCRGAVWIDGHYGPRGYWHPGHWRCPGVVERIDIY
jgi:hypothetical protein